MPQVALRSQTMEKRMLRAEFSSRTVDHGSSWLMRKRGRKMKNEEEKKAEKKKRKVDRFETNERESESESKLVLEDFDELFVRYFLRG